MRTSDSARRRRSLAAAFGVVLLAAPGCTWPSAGDSGGPAASRTLMEQPQARPITVAFAGDVHFERHLADLLTRPDTALAEIGPVLGGADVTIANLEAAITAGGTPEPKEYTFRTGPAALDVLAAAGVDVVTMANNHGADFGAAGLADTLEARGRGPVPVIGIGRDRDDAFAPYRVTVRGTHLAFFAADAVSLETTMRSPIWSAGTHTPGIAAARDATGAATLVRRVARATARGEVAIVYLHWGEEYAACPTPAQRSLARRLSTAGAAAIVGSHSHVLLGAGWLEETYVDYGLGNFVWYHDASPASGVLRLTVRDGRVVRDQWQPATIGPDGTPRPLDGTERSDAVAAWRSLRACSGLRPRAPDAPTPAAPESGPYRSEIAPIGAALAARILADQPSGCPVPLSQLRLLRVSHVDLAGRTRTGRLIVHREHAAGLARVFGELYRARWPIHRMRLAQSLGDDARSMTANNTSGYFCRTVQGTDRWSRHAFGAAIDLNPVQNPYLVAAGIQPSAGKGFAALDRTAGASAPAGVVVADDVVVRAFARIGWSWGGDFSSPDYQHFSAPSP